MCLLETTLAAAATKTERGRVERSYSGGRNVTVWAGQGSQHGARPASVVKAEDMGMVCMWAEP